MRVVSLFAGIGGFDLALTRLGHEIVYANEWDKYSVQTYEKNFKTKPDTRDITTIGADEIPNHDILVGGFPCQPFSIAGKRGGFNDRRGTLFFDIARILEKKNPRLCVLENVKGLLSDNNGRTFKAILTTLNELGYDLQWQVLNSKNFGVPQNRERVFIIGHLRGTSRPQVFPIGEGNSPHEATQTGSSGERQRIRGSDISAAIDANYHKGPGSTRQMIQYSTGSQDTKLSPVDGLSQTLNAGHYNQPKVVVGTLRTHKDGQGFREVKSGLSPTIPARAREDGSGQPVIKEDMKIRRLTPTECERLQGFPDNWTEGVSDTQRYKQLGNAVTVNVVEEIIKRLSFN